MRAEIITIGDELLIGQVINTNQAFIAEMLSGIGIDIGRMTTVGDNLEVMIQSFREAASADLVIVTGGLGPTHDDVTKKAVCEFFDTELTPNLEVRRSIENQLADRKVPWTPAADEQTLFPQKAKVFLNRKGSAAGMLFEKKGQYFIVMPGVPYEMIDMMTETVVPFLQSVRVEMAFSHRTLRTTGISESNLSRTLGDLDEILRLGSLAFLPSPFGVRLRITAAGKNSEEAKEKIRDIEARIREKAEKYIFGTDEETLEMVLGRILREKQMNIAVAESCTGGLIADLLTNVSGSSQYFERGIIAYSNESKTTLLGVPADLIASHGSVSREVATAMAEGIRNIAGTEVGISTTGIAGPAGGTPEKPVGLVWVGYADRNGSLAMKFNFGNDRRRVKERSAAAALELVRRKVMRLG